MLVCTPSQTLGRSPAVSCGSVRKRFRHCVEVHDLIKVARQTLLGDIFGRLTREESLLHSYLGGTPDACSFRVVQLEAFTVRGVRYNRPPPTFSGSFPIHGQFGGCEGLVSPKARGRPMDTAPCKTQAHKRPTTTDSCTQDPSSSMLELGGDFEVARPKRACTCVIFGSSLCCLLLLRPLLWLLFQPRTSPLTFHCQAGYAKWESGWSILKQVFCCRSLDGAASPL